MLTCQTRIHPSFLQPEVDETVHLVSLAADFQQYDFRAFSATYNPDDLRELGMLFNQLIKMSLNVAFMALQPRRPARHIDSSSSGPFVGLI